jgi:hypothetical protein
MPLRHFLLYRCRHFLLSLAAKQVFGCQKNLVSVYSRFSVALTSNTRSKFNLFSVCLDQPQARLRVEKTTTMKDILIVMTYKLLWR